MLYREIESKIKDHDASLAEINQQKANKNDVNNKIWSMANMGQDIKEKFTGGAVAVVGKNTILEENIINEQITSIKTDFFNYNKNLFNENKMQMDKGINSIGNIVISSSAISNKMYFDRIGTLYLSRANGVRGQIRIKLESDNSNKIAFYTSDDKFISFSNSNPCNIPENADYGVLQFYKPFYEFNLQVEYDEMTDYEKYKEFIPYEKLELDKIEGKIEKIKQDLLETPLNFGLLQYKAFNFQYKYWNGSSFVTSTNRVIGEKIEGSNEVIKLIDKNKDIKCWIVEFQNETFVQVHSSNDKSCDKFRLKLNKGNQYIFQFGYIDNKNIEKEILCNNLFYFYENDRRLKDVTREIKPFVKSFAHQGHNLYAPNNTIHALIDASKNGFYGVETDISWTLDNIPILSHYDIVYADVNKRVNPNIEAPQSNYTNKVTFKELTLEQIQGYDFGYYKSPIYEGTKISTLEEWIMNCKKYGLYIYLDKLEDETEEQIKIIYNILKKYNMLSKAIFNTGINPNTAGGYIAKLYDKAKIVTSSGSWQNAWIGKELSTNWIMQFKNKFPNTKIIVSCKYDGMTIDNICELRDLFNDIEVCSWTVNDEKIYENNIFYCDIIISDFYRAENIINIDY